MPASSCNLVGLCGANLTAQGLKTALEQPILAPVAVVTVVGSNGVTAAQAFSVVGAATAALINPLLLSKIPGININDSSQDTIYVGNQSNPAVIKSLNVGGSNGCGANIEIIDQEGGDFSRIFERISRGGISSTYSLSLKFGWVNTDCKDSSAGQNMIQLSEQLNYIISNITINYSAGGALKFVVECIDAMTDLFDSKVPAVYGPNVFLTDAITQLLESRNLEVEFIHLPDGGLPTFQFDGAGDPYEGPLGTWRGNNRNVLALIREWLLTVKIDGKGVVCRYKPEGGSGKKGIFSISNYTGPICDTTFNSLTQQDLNIGTYVVNGGNCSPVISFQPNVKWVVGPAYGPGGTAGASNPKTVQTPGPTGQQGNCNPNQQPQFNQTFFDIATGWQYSPTVTRDDVLANPIGAAVTKQNNMFMHSLANMAFSPVQADLKIQGDPTYAHSINWFGKYVTIIVINPFQVGTSSCEWTNRIGTSPGCNQILSNANWLIEGVNHDIKDGSFTTTLKVTLAAPGIITQFLAPLGQ
jgi:hypothetical protein